MGEKVSLEDLKQIIRELSEAQKQGEAARQRLAEQVSEAHRQTEVALKEVAEAQKKTEEAQRETAEAQQRTEESLKKTQAVVREQSESLKSADGNFTRKWGRFLEGFVKGNLVALLQKRGIEVGRLERRRDIPSHIPGESAGDFDLVALNGKEIVVIEVKTTLSASKLEKFLSHLKKFKSYFPEYEGRIIYGGVAYMDTDKNDDSVGERVMEEGLFAIVAPGGDAKVAKVLNPEDFTPKEF